MIKMTPEASQNLDKLDSGDEAIRFKQSIDTINDCIVGLEITSQFVKLPQVETVIKKLEFLKQILPADFKSMIFGEIYNQSFKTFTLTILDNKHFEVSIKQVEEPKPELKRKWWQFGVKKS